MNRIDSTFNALKQRKRKACVVYLTVGYPNIQTTEKLVLALRNQGVNVFELGMPFSDPLADGPVIQQASMHALKQQVTQKSVFALASRLRKKIDSPLLMMGYYNPILQYGLTRFAHDAAKSGLDGIIVPDLPIEESAAFESCLRKEKVHFINFVAPTTSAQRMQYTARKAKGFIYYVSLTGVTGTRKKLPTDIARKVRLLKRYTKTPVCVGFGVSTSKQFRATANASDGVIVGSAILKRIDAYRGSKQLVPRVAAFVKQLLHPAFGGDCGL